MQNKKIDFLGNFEELPSKLYILLGVVCLALHTAVCYYTELSPALSGLIFFIIYAVGASAVYIFFRKRMLFYRMENDASNEHNTGVISTFKEAVKVPYAVVNEHGRIVTVNAAMKKIFGKRETLYNANIFDLCAVSLDDLLARRDAALNSEEEVIDAPDIDFHSMAEPDVTIADREFTIDLSPVKSKGRSYFMLIFNDVTDYRALSALYTGEAPVVAYIVLDNLDEIAQYVTLSYQSEAAQVDSILKEWARGMGGIIREYERFKYLLFFPRNMLSRCIRQNFDILDVIRGVRLGDDNMPITVSMGIAVTGDNFAARERDALTALDMALQRGGDQAVIKDKDKNEYFGGKTKSQQKRTRNHSIVIAKKLSAMIANASNVLVMGHSNPDFDSIGACVAIACLARFIGVDVKIVTDTKNENFRSCTERLLSLPEYKNTFIDGVSGLAEFNFNTLLVIVDANNFAILEAPEIAEKSFRTVVIDHHIKKQEFKTEPQLPYIDPSASSACELVSELLEQSLPEGILKKEEANVILAGIMVDTKNFTRTVGTRTFAAALYLRSAGARPEVARTFFEENFEDFKSEAMFGNDIEMVRDCVAISASSGCGTPHDRIAAAKTADKLLTIRNIAAAFALVSIGGTVHISARSDGTVNVQRILEKIGGGGHFDSAGAAVKDSEMDKAKSILISAINEYFDTLT